MSTTILDGHCSDVVVVRVSTNIQLHQTPQPKPTTFPFPSHSPLTRTQSSSNILFPVLSCPYLPSPVTQTSPSAVSVMTCPNPTPTSTISTPPLISTNLAVSSSERFGSALILFSSPARPPQIYKSSKESSEILQIRIKIHLLYSETAAPVQPPAATFSIGIPPKNESSQGYSADSDAVGSRPRL